MFSQYIIVTRRCFNQGSLSALVLFDKTDITELHSELARYLLQVEEESRLLPVRDLAARCDTSTGSVSGALIELEEFGAVRRARRGRMGSFVKTRSLSKLWWLATGEPMVIAFPLPSCPRLEGLATALKTVLVGAGVDAYLIFIRGSHTRLKALEEGRCHAAVMSAFATDELYDDEESIVLCLPPESYVTEHCVFYHRKGPPQGRKLRVAIDGDSHDIERLTEMEFAGQDVQFVPVTYVQIPRHLRDGSVDAAVWNIDDMSIHLGEQIAQRPLSGAVRRTVGKRTTAAAIVTGAEDRATHAVLEGILDADKIGAIQAQVMAGEIVPEY